MLNKLLIIWGKIFKTKQEQYGYRFVKNLPAKLHSKTVYLQTHLDIPWQAVMECPCGCKDQIILNLVKKYRPNWRYSIDNKTKISLTPSVRRTVGCKSHFFLRKGKIDWCAD